MAADLDPDLKDDAFAAIASDDDDMKLADLGLLSEEDFDELPSKRKLTLGFLAWGKGKGMGQAKAKVKRERFCKICDNKIPENCLHCPEDKKFLEAFSRLCKKKARHDDLAQEGLE